MTVLGVDVSVCQARMSWADLAAGGVRFAWIKAIGGQLKPPAIYNDSRFAAHADDAAPHVDLVGGYGFFSPALGVKEQADAFADRVAPHKFRLPPMIDFEVMHEVDPALAASRAAEWCARVEDRLGQRVVVYSFPSFLQSIPAHALADLATRDLIISHFGVHPVTGKILKLDAPTIPRPWTKYAVWQRFGNLGPIDQTVETEGRRAFRFHGAPFDIDRDEWPGTIVELYEWAAAHGRPVAPTDPAPPPSTLRSDEFLGGGTPNAPATPLRAGDGAEDHHPTSGLDLVVKEDT